MASGDKYVSDEEYQALLNKLYKSKIDEDYYKTLIGEANNRTYDYGSINQKIPIKLKKKSSDSVENTITHSTKQHPFRMKVRHINNELETDVNTFRESDYIETKTLILK